MKKFSYLLVLLLFAFFACQTDNVNTETEALESETYELKRIGEPISGTEKVNMIPEKYADNPEAYIASQMQSIAKDEVTYGCVTFINGIAYINSDCGGISGGIPDDVEDCKLKGVRYIECGEWNANPDCVICAVAFIVECDGQLGWILGYNIICSYPQQPLSL